VRRSRESGGRGKTGRPGSLATPRAQGEAGAAEGRRRAWYTPCKALGRSLEMPRGARPSWGMASTGRKVAHSLAFSGVPALPASDASGRLIGRPASTAPAGLPSSGEDATCCTLALGTRNVTAARDQSVWYMVTPPHLGATHGGEGKARGGKGRGLRERGGKAARQPGRQGVGEGQLEGAGGAGGKTRAPEHQPQGEHGACPLPPRPPVPLCPPAHLKGSLTLIVLRSTSFPSSAPRRLRSL
jgi:hypothetical protein